MIHRVTCQREAEPESRPVLTFLSLHGRRTYYVPGSVLGAEETTAKKIDKILAVTVFTVLLGETDNKTERSDIECVSLKSLGEVS